MDMVHLELESSKLKTDVVYVQGHNTGQCWVGLDLVYFS